MSDSIKKESYIMGKQSTVLDKDIIIALFYKINVHRDMQLKYHRKRFLSEAIKSCPIMYLLLSHRLL